MCVCLVGVMLFWKNWWRKLLVSVEMNMLQLKYSVKFSYDMCQSRKTITWKNILNNNFKMWFYFLEFWISVIFLLLNFSNIFCQNHRIILYKINQSMDKFFKLTTNNLFSPSIKSSSTKKHKEIILNTFSNCQ